MFQSANFLQNPAYGYMVEEAHWRCNRVERTGRGYRDVAATTRPMNFENCTTASTGDSPSTRILPPKPRRYFNPRKTNKPKPSGAGKSTGDSAQKPEQLTTRTRSDVLPNAQFTSSLSKLNTAPHRKPKSMHADLFSPINAEERGRTVPIAEPEDGDSEENAATSPCLSAREELIPGSDASDSSGWVAPQSSLEGMPALSPAVQAIRARSEEAEQQYHEQQLQLLLHKRREQEKLQQVSHAEQGTDIGNGSQTVIADENNDGQSCRTLDECRRTVRPRSAPARRRNHGRPRQKQRQLKASKASKASGYEYFDRRKRPVRVREYHPHTSYKAGRGYLYDRGKPTKYQVFRLSRPPHLESTNETESTSVESSCEDDDGTSEQGKLERSELRGRRRPQSAGAVGGRSDSPAQLRVRKFSRSHSPRKSGSKTRKSLKNLKNQSISRRTDSRPATPVRIGDEGG
eukprot:INCI8884.2.p1 GENE.INCI8884.2~~INCI8884.2.p1  ORF type:complete len:459 (+),score=59.24 INCI8884.2:203-1579(+)